MTSSVSRPLKLQLALSQARRNSQPHRNLKHTDALTFSPHEHQEVVARLHVLYCTTVTNANYIRFPKQNKKTTTKTLACNRSNINSVPHDRYVSQNKTTITLDSHSSSFCTLFFGFYVRAVFILSEQNKFYQFCSKILFESSLYQRINSSVEQILFIFVYSSEQISKICSDGHASEYIAQYIILHNFYTIFYEVRCSIVATNH